MSETYGFYDAVYDESTETYDRVYSAQQMSAIFDGIINDGIFQTIANPLYDPDISGSQKTVSSFAPSHPSASGQELDVIIGPGRCWFNSTWTYLDNNKTLTLDSAPAAGSAQKRIDAIVIEVDKDNRENSIKIVKGTAAATALATKPTLTDTQYPICYVTLAAGETQIGGSTTNPIEDARGSTSSPWITGILETVSTTELMSTWSAGFETFMSRSQSEFNAFMDDFESLITDEQAAELEAQIQGLKKDVIYSNNITVASSSWHSATDTGYYDTAPIADYPYMARITNTALSLAQYSAIVNFSLAARNAYDLCGECIVWTNGYYDIFCATIPSGNVVIDNVVFFKVGDAEE